MKKLFGFALALCSLVLLAGCAKEEIKEQEEGKRIYSKTYVEEMEGNEVEVTNVVVFNEDGTGTLAIQDIIPITYDDSTISYVEGDNTYEYKIDGDKLTINFGEFEEEYSLSDESVLEKIPE